MSMWPDAAKKETGVFWREEMMAVVPRALIDYVAPWIKQLEEMEAAGTLDASGKGFLSSALFMMGAMLQDALELADTYPDNPVFAMLLQNPLFR